MRPIFLYLFAFLPLMLQAQTEAPMGGDDSSTPGSALSIDSVGTVQPVICFGYLSYDAALKSMAEYAQAQDSIRIKREAFEGEMNRVEEEFNQKYESFLEGQKEFPRTILLKRQKELQELMQRNLEFKAQARQELKETEEAQMRPVHARLNQVLAEVAREFGLALVINTDANACPFIDSRLGMNIQSEVEEYLQK